MERQKKKSFRWIWLGYAAVVVVFLVAGVFLLNVFLHAGEQRPKRKVQMVTLVKPPPPPPPEKPPEPEIEKEEVVEPEPVETPPEEVADTPDEAPPGRDLGVDAEGTAGGDGFGLVGRKGGRSLIGGGGGEQSLLRKYAWYTRIVQEEIRKAVRKRLEENGGIPGGRPRTMVKIELDEGGRIVDFRIVGPSGNEKMDAAVRETLGQIRLAEPPPAGMPSGILIRISAQG